MEAMCFHKMRASFLSYAGWRDKRFVTSMTYAPTIKDKVSNAQQVKHLLLMANA